MIDEGHGGRSYCPFQLYYNVVYGVLIVFGRHLLNVRCKEQVSSPTWSGKGYLYFALWMTLPGVQLCEQCCFEVASEN